MKVLCWLYARGVVEVVKHNPTSAVPFGRSLEPVLISDDPVYCWREKAGNRDAGAPADLAQLFGRQFASACTIDYSHRKRHDCAPWIKGPSLLIVGRPDHTNNLVW
jgi:hypothetical protein